MHSTLFTVASVAALAASVQAAADVHPCWGTCFQQHNITGRDSLCNNTPVSACISTTCQAQNSTAATGKLSVLIFHTYKRTRLTYHPEYTEWLAKYCGDAECSESAAATTAYTTPAAAVTPGASSAPVSYGNGTAVAPTYSMKPSSGLASSTGSSPSATSAGPAEYTGGAAVTGASVLMLFGGLAANILV